MTSMSDKTHLENARRKKEEANEAYVQQDYRKAIRLYHESLLHARAINQLSNFGLIGLARLERRAEEMEDMDDIDNVIDDTEKSGSFEKAERCRIDSTSRGEEIKDEANAIILKCYNNLAACILHGDNRNADDYLRAVEYCDKVLSLESQNEKAQFRKGLCLARANLHEKAIDVFKACANNKDAQVQILKCEQALREDRRRRDEIIRQNFARAQARDMRFQEQQNGNHGGQEAVGGVGLPMVNGSTPSG